MATSFSTYLIVLYIYYIISTISEPIYCRDPIDCAGKDIECNSTSLDNTCEIRCVNADSCAESRISCASNKPCTIICSGENSCKQLTTNCPKTANNPCTISGDGNYALQNMQFNCQGSNCSVYCQGIASCLDATFNAFSATYPDSNLTIKCNDDAIDPGNINGQNITEPNFACKNIKIHCPKNKNGNKLCAIKSITQSSKNIHTALKIYAVNNWDDIDLTKYNSNVSGTSSMFCNNNLSATCLINNITNLNEWNCIDTTSICYKSYISNDDKDNTNYALIIGLSIGAFFCLIIALCIGLYLKKDEELFFTEKDKKKDVIIDENDEQIRLKEAETTEPQISMSEDNNICRDDTSEDFREYKKLMQHIFYTFAGYTPWAKKTGLYMNTKELQTFLDIVNIQDPVEEVLALIDTDITDGRLTINEWMDYFVDKKVNPHIFEIKHHIEGQVTWSLLVKALKIFEITDKNHSGKLEYGEFQQFGHGIGLNDEETEILWNTMDTNNSGAISIVELFEWFRFQLYQQRGRIVNSKQPSLLCSKSDLMDLEEFRQGAKSIGIHKEIIKEELETDEKINDK
eukprot:79920_1